MQGSAERSIASMSKRTEAGFGLSGACAHKVKVKSDAATAILSKADTPSLQFNVSPQFPVGLTRAAAQTWGRVSTRAAPAERTPARPLRRAKVRRQTLPLDQSPEHRKPCSARAALAPD